MGIRNFFTKIADWSKDHASDLKMWIGTAEVVGGTVEMCRGAVKAAGIIREYRAEKEAMVDAEASELRKMKLKTAGKVALKMLPGAVLEGAGLTSMWSGYTDVKAAFIGVGAAYTGLQEFIGKYREGVREKYGVEADEELAYGTREEEVVLADENGKESTEKIRIFPRDIRKMPSPYARYFVWGEADGAEKSLDYNRRFLELQQDVANRYFRAHGKLMLNDVYDMLGIRRSKAGNHVGWVYDKEAPEGDNCIDLRIREVLREVLDDDGKPCGWERVMMIDPNVDGMVEDKMLRLGLIDE